MIALVQTEAQLDKLLLSHKWWRIHKIIMPKGLYDDLDFKCKFSCCLAGAINWPDGGVRLYGVKLMVLRDKRELNFTDIWELKREGEYVRIT